MAEKDLFNIDQIETVDIASEELVKALIRYAQTHPDETDIVFAVIGLEDSHRYGQLAGRSSDGPVIEISQLIGDEPGQVADEVEIDGHTVEIQVV